MKRVFAELKRRNVIRVAMFYGAGAWLVLQVADVLLEILDAPEGSLRLVAIVAALGFPLALILAWAFEMTPEGIKRESEVDRSAYDTAQANRRLDVATITLLVVAITFLAWTQFSDRDPRLPGVDGPRDLSIAVLPFVNMSVDPDNEYFSEGLSEELLNVLARIEDFRVAGRTSSFAFKGQQQDLRAIGERLSVANILEGSVRKQGNQIRVTAQLIDARTGYHLWSDTYDRQLDDVFAIQDEIATEVVKALRLTLLAGDQAVIQQTAKGDVEAYNLFLRGQYHVRLRTRDGLERALEEFQQAILIDPDYAPPYVGIAMVYALLDNYSYRGLDETGELARRALERALALDSQSDEAWAVRGLLLGQGPGAMQRQAEARAALERAIEINPNNAFAHLWRAGTLAPDLEAMRASLHRAYELDPLSPVIVYRRVMDAVQSGDEAALTRFQAELEEIAPDWFITWQAAGSIALQAGEVAEAALAFERAAALNPEYAAVSIPLAMALEILGHERKAEALLVQAQDRLGEHDVALMIAAVQARRLVLGGDYAAAFRRYEPAVAVAVAVDPMGERISELAMLEIGAGQAAAAETRLLASLSAESIDDLGKPAIDELLQHLSLAMAGYRQGRTEDVARISAGIRTLLRELESIGFTINFLPMVEGILEHFEGRPEALESGLHEAMRQGFRTPPATLYWMIPLDLDDQRMRDLVDMMARDLAEQRLRYDAAHAGG
jgi:adenylate cyclase